MTFAIATLRQARQTALDNLRSQRGMHAQQQKILADRAATVHATEQAIRDIEAALGALGEDVSVSWVGF